MLSRGPFKAIFNMTNIIYNNQIILVFHFCTESMFDSYNLTFSMLRIIHYFIRQNNKKIARAIHSEDVYENNHTTALLHGLWTT